MRFDAFVSYASDDREAAFSICATLERSGLRCWIAPRDIGLGRSYAEEIVLAIERASSFVLLLSPAANRSAFVQSELERAFCKGRAIFPVRVDRVPPARGLELFLGSRQWVDAFDGRLESAATQLAASVREASPGGDVARDLATSLANIELGEQRATGPFGPIYTARHRTLDVAVAVKIIKGSLAGADAVDRSLADARLFARLDHPNLVRLLDAGRVEGDGYLLLELLDGGSLRRVHSAPAEEVLAFARQALSALQAVHDAKLLHRNVKPANLMLRKSDGRLKLSEVGLTCRSLDELGARNPLELPFAAPELGEDPPRYSVGSDLYALGMTLVCVALPDDPFPREPKAILEWVRCGARATLEARTDLDPRLVSLVARCLSPRPEDRPATAAEALASLSATERRNSRHPDPSAARIGPWVLGDLVFESVNWKCWAVTHQTAGTPARLALLMPNGDLGRAASALVLDSAARASALGHVGFLDVLDWGQHEEMPFVVTQAQGVPLSTLIEAQGACDEVTALEFSVSIAGALEHLHSAGLVYQAVTPGSVVLRADARSVQLGWSMLCAPIGAPYVSEEGTVRLAGVPLYLAPEAFGTKGRIEPALDLWGLGEVLYYALAGKSAYDSEGSTLLAVALAKGQPARPVREVAANVTAPTAALVAKLLALDASARPTAAHARATAEAILRRLRGRRRAEAPPEELGD